MKAIGRKVLIKVLDSPEPDSFLAMPKDTKLENEKLDRGRVLSIGADAKAILEDDIKENNVVVFGTYAGKKILDGDDILRFMDFDEIYGVLGDS